MIVVTFPSTLGPVSLGLASNSVTLIAGPNGVGKSALLYQIYRAAGFQQAVYYSGHRQINLNQNIDSINQDSLQLRQNSFNSFDMFSRYRNAWAEDQFKGILRNLINLENAYNRQFRKSVAVGGEREAERASLKASPLDQLNVVFSRAGLPVQLDLNSRGLSAIRDGRTYAVEALSDGERAALFIASAIITQDARSVLLIDEPEKHLHPSITGVLIETALRTRNDISVVLCSHDLSLIERLDVSNTIYVKNSTVTSTVGPEQRVFDVEILPSGLIPEQLRLDVLGARSRILYVEGTDTSRDSALYASVYNGWKVIGKGGSQAVIDATYGVRESEHLHWLLATGLIDRDGRSMEEVEKFKHKGVFSLPGSTVENLFFLADCQKCFVEADLSMRSGPPLHDRQQRLETAVQETLAVHRDNIIARRVLWRVQRDISSQPLSVKDVREERIDSISVDVAELKRAITREFDAAVSDKTATEVLTTLPIKNTDLPDNAARALGATSFRDYCEVVQRQIDLESPSGINVVSALKAVLPNIEPTPGAQTLQPPAMGPRRVGLPPAPVFSLDPATASTPAPEVAD